MILLPFFRDADKVTFQRLNRFSYDIMIGRVATRIIYLKPVYFVWNKGSKFNSTVLEVNFMNGAVTHIIDKKLFSFMGCLTVFVKNDLYVYNSRGGNGKLDRIVGIEQRT